MGEEQGPILYNIVDRRILDLAAIVDERYQKEKKDPVWLYAADRSSIIQIFHALSIPKEHVAKLLLHTVK